METFIKTALIFLHILCLNSLLIRRPFTSFKNFETSAVAFSAENFADKQFGRNLLDTFEKNTEASRQKSVKVLDKNSVLCILESSIKMMLQEPKILSINRPIRADGSKGSLSVCGDTHGQFLDLANIFHEDIGGYPTADNPFIFNGDLVDRGRYSFEGVMCLLAIKLADPQAVHILRGNHETSRMYLRYGFKDEINEKYDQEVMHKFEELFEALPVAAVLQDEVFVVHGGIGPTAATCTIDELNTHVMNRKLSKVSGEVFEELLWSDPDDEDSKFSESPRGLGSLFGKDATKSFLKRNKLKLLIRSHEVRDGGYDIMHNGKCITVFSAPNYCRVSRNKGAIVRFEGDGMKPSFIVFDAKHYPIENH